MNRRDNFYDEMDSPRRRRENPLRERENSRRESRIREPLGRETLGRERKSRDQRGRDTSGIGSLGSSKRDRVPYNTQGEQRATMPGPLSGYANSMRDNNFNDRQDNNDRTQQIDQNMIMDNKNRGKNGKKPAELKNKNKPKKKKKHIFLKILGGIFIFLLIAIIGLSVWGYKFLDGLKSDGLPAGKAPGNGESLSILILGMDIGDTENLESKASRRTDTVMVFNYNPNTLKTHVVSIPRDTLIEATNGEITKINAAYGIGGEEEVISHVEDFLEININYVVEIDYAAFRNLIDAIGGIEMEIEQDMIYDDDGQNLHINFKGGTVEKLDGKKAEEFFRWRKNNDGSGLAMGDIGRIEQQQKFISKVIAKCVSPTIAPKIPDIIDVVKANVQTNMGAGDILKASTSVLKNLKPENLIMTTLKGRFDGPDWAVDPGMNDDLIAALNAKGPISIIDKSKIKIMVLNGTDQPGLAGQIQAMLNSEGYPNVEAGNGEPRENGVIQTANKDLREALYSDLYINAHEEVVPSEYSGYDAVIIIGEDYFTMFEE